MTGTEKKTFGEIFIRDARIFFEPLILVGKGLKGILQRLYPKNDAAPSKSSEVAAPVQAHATEIRLEKLESKFLSLESLLREQKISAGEEKTEGERASSFYLTLDEVNRLAAVDEKEDKRESSRSLYLTALDEIKSKLDAIEHRLGDEERRTSYELRRLSRELQGHQSTAASQPAGDEAIEEPQLEGVPWENLRPAITEGSIAAIVKILESKEIMPEDSRDEDLLGFKE